jgi:hypothetical protein
VSCIVWSVVQSPSMVVIGLPELSCLGTSIHDPWSHWHLGDRCI